MFPLSSSCTLQLKWLVTLQSCAVLSLLEYHPAERNSALSFPLHTNSEGLFSLQCFISKSTVILNVPWISALLRNSAFLNNFTVNWVFSCLYKCHWTMELTLPRYTMETSQHCFLYSSWFYNKLCRNCTTEPLSNFPSLHFCIMVFT